MLSNRLTRSRIEGGILGLLIGDAVGVPYEFYGPHQLPPIEQIEMTPPPGFHRSHSDAPIGTWSDDGAQALALLASLLERGTLDLDDFARRLLDWRARGRYTPDDRMFDIGNQTERALSALDRGVRPESAGPRDEWDNGNGSLMRALPLALWHTGSDEELAADATRQSLVTHGHIRSQLCCALYCLWARQVILESDDPWRHAVDTLRGFHPSGTAARTELDDVIDPDGEHQPLGSGYVVDSLHSAHWAVRQGPYEAVIRRAVAVGNDTDTTACIAGGIAGVRDGVEAIPQRWREGLRGTSIVQPLLEGLVARHAASGGGRD